MEHLTSPNLQLLLFLSPWNVRPWDAVTLGTWRTAVCGAVGRLETQHLQSFC